MRRKCRDSGQWSIQWLLMSAALVVAVVKANGVSPLPHGQDGVVRKAPALVKKPPALTVEKCLGAIPRRDPLNHFKRYKGGFNVTNMHYWSSLAYTGIWGYSAAIISVVMGVASIWWQCSTWPSRGGGIRKFNPNSDLHHSVPVWCVIQFSILLLAASGVILWGNIKLGRELRTAAGTLVSTVDKVTAQVDGAINLIPPGKIGPIANQEVAKKFLLACNNLASTFRELTKRVKMNKAQVYKLFSSMKVAISVIAAFIVILVVIGLVSMLKSWHTLLFALYSMAIFILVCTWMLAGFSFVLASLAIDCCQAMEAYDRNPHNSSIAQLMPCLTPQAAAEALDGAKRAIKTVIRRSNAAVDLLNHQEQRLAAKGVINHPTIVPHVCDPFGPEPSFFPVGCNPADGSFTRFEEDYGKYRCETDDIEACLASPKPIPNFAFIDATEAMNATKDVYLILPTIFRIITCNFVKITFEDILMHHCGALKGVLTVLWVSLLIASVAMIPLLGLWAMHGRTFSDDRVKYILRKKAREFGFKSSMLTGPDQFS